MFRRASGGKSRRLLSVQTPAQGKGGVVLMAKGPRTGRVSGRTSRAPVRQLLADTLAPEPATEVDANSLNKRRPQALPDAAGTRLRRGFSHHVDARRAAVELHDAIAQPDAAFVLVFCSPQYDLPVLGEALADVFGETLVIGCTTAGEITPAGYMTGSITGGSFPSSDFTAGAGRSAGLG